MNILNNSECSLRVRQKEGKLYIFCLIRKKYYSLTPEEWVRQHAIEFLIKEKLYSPSSIAVEKNFKLYRLNKRLDVVVYQKEKPFIIVECKSPTIHISGRTLDQINRYNLILKSHYLMITNGLRCLFFEFDSSKNTLTPLSDLPLKN